MGGMGRINSSVRDVLSLELVQQERLKSVQSTMIGKASRWCPGEEGSISKDPADSDTCVSHGICLLDTINKYRAPNSHRALEIQIYP